MTIPERSDVTKNQEQRRIETNSKLKKWAMDNSDVTWFLDLSDKLPSSSEYWDDDVHPSKHGYDVMATLIYHSLERMYKDLTMKISDSTMEDDDSSGYDQESDSGSGPAGDSGDYSDDDNDSNEGKPTQ